jgi:hypothetical protein
MAVSIKAQVTFAFTLTLLNNNSLIENVMELKNYSHSVAGVCTTHRNKIKTPM